MMITEGAPLRAPGVTGNSIRHLAVDGPIDVVLWCTGSRARETVNREGRRFCPRCLALAQDWRDPGDIPYGWPVDDQEYARELTAEEAPWVRSLQRLAKRCPPTLMLVSMDGRLEVVDKKAYHAGNDANLNMAERQDSCTLASIEGIENDGGGW